MRTAGPTGNGGMTLLETIISGVIVSITLAFVVGVFRYSNKYQRGALAANAAAGLDEDFGNRIAKAIKTAYFAGGCDAGTLKASIEGAAPSGIVFTGIDPTTTIDETKIGPRAQQARARCLAGSNFAAGGDLYFCLLITNTAGSRVPTSSAVAMQPFFGEFRFRVSNLKTGALVPCGSFGAVPLKSGFLHYQYYWSAPDRLFKTYAGLFSSAVLMP